MSPSICSLTVSVAVARQHPAPTVAGVSLPPARAALGALLGILVVLGLGLAILFSRPILVLTIPFLLIGALVFARFPGIPIVATVLLTATVGTTAAHLGGIPSVGLTEVLLVTLWLGVVGSVVASRSEYQVRPWPGLLMVVAFILLNLAWLFVASRTGPGFESFRLSTLFLISVPILALGTWSDETARRIVKAIMVVGIAVAGYCVLRYAIGSSSEELVNARFSRPGLPFAEELRFFGSFNTAQELAGWCAVMLPLAVALIIYMRGRWRVGAVALLVVCVISLLASDIRTGIAAAAAGVAVTVGVFAFARAFPSGDRLATTLVLSAVLLIGGVGGYLVVIAGSAERVERFEGLFSPGDDFAFEIRQQRWDAAWDEVVDEPFGHGLGTTGAAALRNADVLPVGPTPLDSSYLKVGIEQGVTLMVFYVASLLLLLAGLVYKSLTTPDRWKASLGMAACGTLASLIVLFYGSLYSELPSVVVVAWLIVGMAAAGFTTLPSRRSHPG